MATLFSGLKPVRVLHVTVGTGTGDGSVKNPFHSIQAAVDAATPGTAIIVHAGVYSENIKISHQRSGTETAPIWLVSGDGPQAASIVAPSNTKPVIQALGVDNYVIEGFRLSGGYDGIQFSQSGRDFSNLVNNVLIQGNVITNVVHDGIKVGQANNIKVLDNKIDNVATEEGIDFVAVNNALIARNEISNVKGSSAAIFAKGGSIDITIQGNYIHDVSGDGISAGGNTTLTSFRPGVSGFEAKNVLIDGNRIEDVAKRPVSVRGGINVDVTGNLLEGSTRYGSAVYITTGSQGTAKPVVSRDVYVADNKLTAVKSLLTIDSGNNNAIVHTDNAGGSWVHKAGPEALTLPAWAVAAGKLIQPAAVAPPAAPAIVTPLPSPTPVPASASKPATTPTVSVSPAPMASAARDSAAAQNTIIGTSGKDNLVGTAQADKLDGLSREDVMAGGKGDDTYIVSGYKDVVVELTGSGIDTVELFDSKFWLPENVENLIARASTGALLVGNALDNKIAGGAGDDVIVAGAGQDILAGGGGADRFIIGTSDSSDIIADFDSADQIILDGAHFSNFAQLRSAMTQIGQDVSITLGEGQTLTLKGIQMANLRAAQFGLDGVATTTSGSASSTITISGTKAAERLDGNSAHNLIDGGGGSDILIGGGGDDTYAIRDSSDRIVEVAGGGTDTANVYVSSYALAYQVENAVIKIDIGARIVGNAIANIITGGDGNDTIVSGGGKDLLTGGLGGDRFVVLPSDIGADRITDFISGEDKLDLSALIDAYADGKVTTAKTGEGLQIYFDYGTQHDLVATLTGVTQVMASDFIL